MFHRLSHLDRTRNIEFAMTMHVDPDLIAESLTSQCVCLVYSPRLLRPDTRRVLLHANPQRMMNINLERLEPARVGFQLLRAVAPLFLAEVVAARRVRIEQDLVSKVPAE